MLKSIGIVAMIYSRSVIGSLQSSNLASQSASNLIENVLDALAMAIYDIANAVIHPPRLWL